MLKHAQDAMWSAYYSYCSAEVDVTRLLSLVASFRLTHFLTVYPKG